MDWSLGNFISIGLRAIANRAEIERVGKKVIAQIVQVEELFGEVREILNKVAPELLVDLRVIPAAALPNAEQLAPPRYDVRWVQEALNHLLHDIGVRLTVDGKMGEKTRGAIENYQLRRNLTVDGWLGPATMAQLDADIRSAHGSRGR